VTDTITEARGQTYTTPRDVTARRWDHVHEAAHTELLPHWDGPGWDGSHFGVSESPWTRRQGVGG